MKRNQKAVATWTTSFTPHCAAWTGRLSMAGRASSVPARNLMRRRMPVRSNPVQEPRGDGNDLADQSTPLNWVNRWGSTPTCSRCAGRGIRNHHSHRGDPSDQRRRSHCGAEHIKPDRIGHGVRAAQRGSNGVVGRDPTTQICPTSNLHTRAVESLDGFDSSSTHLLTTACRSRSTRVNLPCNTNLQREFAIIEERI